MADQEKPIRDLRLGPIEGDVLSRRPRAAQKPAPDEEPYEGPSADDLARFNNVTRTCPECGKDVFDDVSECYHCGHALDALPIRRTPIWVIVLAVLLVVGLSLPLVLGAFLR